MRIVKKRVRKARPPKPSLGWREWVSLPDLRLPSLKVKLDTGARSSALHAINLETFRRRGTHWVRFGVQPIQRNNRLVIACEAPVLDERRVRSSSGQAELRYVIETLLGVGEDSWPIEITLADRDQMGFRMLLGRQALAKRFLVDPGRSFLGPLSRTLVKRRGRAGS